MDKNNKQYITEEKQVVAFKFYCLVGLAEFL